MRPCVFAFSLLLLGTLTGCPTCPQPPDFSIEGRATELLGMWEGGKFIGETPNLAILSDATIEFRQNGTFSLTVLDSGTTFQADGHWAASGDHIEFGVWCSNALDFPSAGLLWGTFDFEDVVGTETMAFQVTLAPLARPVGFDTSNEYWSFGRGNGMTP